MIKIDAQLSIGYTMPSSAEQKRKLSRWVKLSPSRVWISCSNMILKVQQHKMQNIEPRETHPKAVLELGAQDQCRGCPVRWDQAMGGTSRGLWLCLRFKAGGWVLSKQQSVLRRSYGTDLGFSSLGMFCSVQCVAPGCLSKDSLLHFAEL